VPRSNNSWNYTSIPQYAFTGWCSVKEAQGQLYLYLYGPWSFIIVLKSPY